MRSSGTSPNLRKAKAANLVPPLSLGVRSHSMAPFRLEELLRVVAISSVSVVGGTIVLFVLQSLSSSSVHGSGQLLMLIFMGIGIFAIAFPTSVVAGLLLHLLLRLRTFHRFVLLPLFLALGYACGGLAIGMAWAGTLPRAGLLAGFFFVFFFILA
jgi:hypothetical protein